MFSGAKRSVESFRFLTSSTTDDAVGSEQMAAEKTAVIIATHGYGDSGVTPEGFLQSLERYSTDITGDIVQKIEAEGVKGFRKLRSALYESHQKGRSGLLTNFAAALAIGLCTESDEPIQHIDVVSPTLRRSPDLLPEGSAIFSGGVEGRALELLGVILDWVDSQRDPETKAPNLSIPDEVIIAGHSLGAPTVNTLFRVVATISPESHPALKDRTESFAFAKAMLLGDFENKYSPSSSTARLRVVPIDGAVDPHHALFMPQKMICPEEGSVIRKKSIIFPLMRAISRGTTEQITDTLQLEAPFHRRIGQLLCSAPRLQRVLSYTAHLPAVLHEAGAVISAQATEDFATMTRLVEKRNEFLKGSSSAVLINHADDQIFPARTVQRLLKDASYAIANCSPEEQLGKMAQEAKKIIINLTGLGETDAENDTRKKLALHEKVLRLYVAQKNLAAIALITACKLKFAEKLPRPDAESSLAARFGMIIMPGGSHTSIGSADDAQRSSGALFEYSAGERTKVLTATTPLMQEIQPLSQQALRS